MQKLQQRFLEQNFRITPSVKSVFKIIKTANHFLSANEISKLCDNRFDVSTIYRVLEKMQNVKLVHEFQGKWKLCTDPENMEESHHFLICEKCSTAEEIFLDYHEAISAQLSREKNFILRKVHLGFLGICRECHN